MGAGRVIAGTLAVAIDCGVDDPGNRVPAPDDLYEALHHADQDVASFHVGELMKQDPVELASIEPVRECLRQHDDGMCESRRGRRRQVGRKSDTDVTADPDPPGKAQDTAPERRVAVRKSCHLTPPAPLIPQQPPEQET